MAEQSVRRALHDAGGRASENTSLMCGAQQNCVDFFFISAESKVENLDLCLHLLVGIWAPRCVRDLVTLLAPTGYTGTAYVWRWAGQCSHSNSGEPAAAEMRGPSPPLSSQVCLLPPHGQAVQTAAWGRAQGLSLVLWVTSR